MNQFPSLLTATIMLTALPASAGIIGVERFDYPDGAITSQNGGTLWDWKNTLPTSHTGTSSTWDTAFGALTVSGRHLVNSNSGARREYNGNTEDRTFSPALRSLPTIRHASRSGSVTHSTA